MSTQIIPDRKKMPPLGNIPELILQEPENITLQNDMQAHLIRAGQENITRLDIVFEAGSAYQNKRLVAGSVNNLLKEGTSTKSSAEIAGILDYYGAYLNTHYNKDTASVTILSLTKHLDKLLPLLGELLTDSVFHERELDIYLNRQKQRFLVNIEKVKYRASLEFNKLVFGENTAYGQVLSLEDFDKVTREDVLEFYRNHYCPERAYVVLSGHIDDQTVQLVNQHLGTISCQGKSPDEKEILFSAPPQKTEKIIPKKDALQSALRVGKQIINRTHPDFPKLTLLNTILGGYFGSRLMSNLREDKGYTYGAYSYIQTYKKAAYFTIATEVNADYTTKAMDEIVKEIERLCSEPVPDDELTLVKNYTSGIFQKSFDGPLALSDRYITVKDFRLTFAHYKNILEEIKNITANDLMQTAAKYLSSDDMIKLIVGKTE